MINEEIERINVHYFDNFFSFNRDTMQKRQQRTENDLIEALYTRYQFSLLSADKKIDVNKDGLPQPRALVGQNTNKPFDQSSDKEIKLYNYFTESSTDSALHFTLEYVDKITNLRFARTFFLSNLSQNYMHNTFFSEDEDF
jgi:hypothetical protein